MRLPVFQINPFFFSGLGAWGTPILLTNIPEPPNRGVWLVNRRPRVINPMHESASKPPSLQRNHDSYHMYFRDVGGHNHIAHSVLSVLAMGGGPKELKRTYDGLFYECNAVWANAASPTTAAFQMAFMLLLPTLRRFLSVCYSLKDWIAIALISPLSHLIHRPPVRDIDVVQVERPLLWPEPPN